MHTAETPTAAHAFFFLFSKYSSQENKCASAGGRIHGRLEIRRSVIHSQGPEELGLSDPAGKQGPWASEPVPQRGVPKRHLLINRPVSREQLQPPLQLRKGAADKTGNPGVTM